ncbi:MAG: amidohydrolase family protein [Phycisphaerae bacterium]|jgi:predicted TIM-barrel fold metal-dependent hydrolase
MIIDLHCHYAFTRHLAQPDDRFSFEPAEIDGVPAYDSCLAPRVLQRPTWRLWQRYLGFDMRLRPGPELDRQLEQWFERHLLADGPVERCVLLAFDAYHDDHGRRPPLPETRRQLGSDMYVSNSLIRATCRRHPTRFLFGASVHPYRPDALACLDEVFAAGACLLKWMPLHQNINPHDPRSLAFLRRCADLDLPLLIHCGPEFTLATQHSAYRSMPALLDVLRRLRAEGAEPTAIVAHVATPAMPFGDREGFRILVAALAGEFADSPLYADISAMAAWPKVPFLRRLARQQALHSKLLFGSDFPVPPAMLRFRRDLGRHYRAIAAQPAWPQRTVTIYRHLGFNEIVFRRAATLLPNVDHFARLTVTGKPDTL